MLQLRRLIEKSFTSFRKRFFKINIFDIFCVTKFCHFHVLITCNICNTKLIMRFFFSPYSKLSIIRTHKVTRGIEKIQIIERFIVFLIFTTKHGFWVSVSAEEGIQGTEVWKQLHNNLQRNKFFNLLISQFPWKNLWYWTVCWI